MGRLENKIALVTGGNSGIGKATAALFCREGAKVVIAGRREAENKGVVAEITAMGGEITAVRADVSKQEDCKRVVEETIRKYDRIDVLVNSAGIADRHMPINLCTEDWYDQVVRIDQYSVYYMSKYALEHMEKRGVGSIVNVSSIGAKGLGRHRIQRRQGGRQRHDQEHRASVFAHGNPLQRYRTGADADAAERSGGFPVLQQGVCGRVRQAYRLDRTGITAGGPGRSNPLLRQRRLQSRDGPDHLRGSRNDDILAVRAGGRPACRGRHTVAQTVRTVNRRLILQGGGLQ